MKTRVEILDPTRILTYARDLNHGQFAAITYGESELIVFRTAVGLISVDGQHSWENGSFGSLKTYLIEPGTKIQIEVGDE